MIERIIKKRSLYGDLIIILLALSIIAFWRGTWNLMDKYIFPNNFLLSQLTTIVGGILLLIIISKIK
jgi:hypothetical protein